MIISVMLIGFCLALFVLALVGVNRLIPTLIGLGAVGGMAFGAYLVWQGFIGNRENTLLLGCFIFLAGAGALICARAISSD
ncbi:MAG TPA: hypothetical protein VKX46_22340 [Ktedonobacteraceae bacterium]|jgi:hypothetical protein|nr:hypothetical protein [Ktedonobacteraceae bacterium]HLI68879.1 hypothetical protein [Ktedonobacteraceae bacterium]